MKKKIPSNSFAARLTPEQRDQLFEELANGLSYVEATVKVRRWMEENAAAGLACCRPGRAITLTEATPIWKWYQAIAAERRYATAKQVALVAQANCPDDYDEQARRALGQAKFLATLEGLRVSDIASLEKNEIAREKLALEREKLADNLRHQRRDLLIERARLLLERARGGEESEDLQEQIDLALEEIQKMKRGEE